MTKEALIQRLREEAAHELNHETIALILEAAEALAQPAPVQTTAVHITWNSDGVRTVNGIPDYTPPATQRKPLTDVTIKEWAERHDIKGVMTDLRCMAEDAETLYLLAEEKNT